MHYAQKLQKIFLVAFGDHAQLNESIAPTVTYNRALQRNAARL